MRIIRGLLLVVLLLLCTAVLLRTIGLERLGPMLLTRMGMDQVSLALTHVDHQKIAIRSLALTLPHQSGPIPIRLSDAVCHYQLSQLLQGRLSSCSAAAIDITLPEVIQEQTSPASTELPNLDALFKAVDLNRIPVQQLHLPLLRVHYGPTDRANPAVFSFDFTSNPEKRHLLLQVAVPEKSSPLKVALLQEKNSLSGTLRLDLAAVRGLLLLPPPFDKRLPPKGILTARLRHSPTTPLQLELDLTGLHHPLYSIENASLLLECSGPTGWKTLQFSPASQLTINNLQSRGTRLHSLSLNLAGTLTLAHDRWQWQLIPVKPCAIDGLIASKSSFAPLRLDNLNLKLRLDAKQLQMDASLATPLGKGTILVNCNDQRDQSGKGECLLNSQAPLILSPEHNPLNLLTDKPQAEITKGQLAFSLRGQWQAPEPLRLQAKVEATVDQGSLMEIPFSGLLLRQELDVLPQLQSIKSGRLQLTRIQGPVPMEDLQVRIQIRPTSKGTNSVLVFDQGKARLLDGMLRIDQCTYALDGTPTPCQLQLENLNLEPLIALHQVEGLAVSGRLRGQLPLQFSSQGLQIRHGILENEAKGGLIRYQPPKGTMQSSALTAYALAALENLHYQNLAAQVDYQSEGTLAVALQIKGNNPTLDNGRAVQLNLKTEQNLLSLLKSVQYSQSLSSELGRKLMKVTKPKP
ncbi:MAG: YdbH domain-containing protein [Desulfobulbus sp.]|nr:YdbH domain-containing protein [Desulfobulbus sp.]